MSGLILGRTAGEGIKIGDDIQVIVLSTHTGSCRLQIVAPRSIRIDRIKQFEKDALKTKP